MCDPVERACHVLLFIVKFATEVIGVEEDRRLLIEDLTVVNKVIRTNDYRTGAWIE